MTVHAIDECFCGQPATRTIGAISYCHACAETVLAPLRAKHPSSGGHGQQTGPLRPDWGDRHADLTCDHCGATWVGPIGETCGWCIQALDAPRRLKLAEAPPLYNVSGNGQHNAPQAPISTRPSMAEQLLSVDDLCNMPPMDPVVAGLLDFDSVVIAYGARGAAKSFLGIDLCASIASGIMWHGHAVAQTQALYVVAEGAAGFGVRYTAWQQAHYGETLPRSRLVHLPTPVNLLSPGMIGEFVAMIGELGSRFVVLDTLARCMVGGDENTARDAGLAVEQLDEIRRQTGACVFVIHHAGKDASKGGRGSSAFEAAADTVLEIGLTDNIMTITCTKQKNHAEPSPVRLRLLTEGPSAVLADYLGFGEAITKGALKALTALSEIETTGGESASVWKLSSEMPESSFYRARQELVTLALVSNIGTDKQPRYQVTPSGTLALSTDSQHSNGSSPQPLPPLTPLRRGESGSRSDSDTTTDPTLEPF